ncbi:MAG: hypothetical protein ABI645_07490 [Pseudomonadota bacterium]
MLSLKPFLFLAAGLAAGVLLALASFTWHLSIGWIGAIGLVGWALYARRRWTMLESTTGLGPSPPERMLWLRLSGTALILGHLVAAIMLVGNNLRVGYGNSLAADSWTMAVGYMLAALLFRRDSNQSDERHQAIESYGHRIGYGASIVLLLPLIAWLAFTPRHWRVFFSDFVIANVLIALLLASYVALLFVQLVGYARDTR